MSGSRGGNSMVMLKTFWKGVDDGRDPVSASSVLRKTNTRLMKADTIECMELDSLRSYVKKHIRYPTFEERVSSTLIMISRMQGDIPSCRVLHGLITASDKVDDKAFLAALAGSVIRFLVPSYDAIVNKGLMQRFIAGVGKGIYIGEEVDMGAESMFLLRMQRSDIEVVGAADKRLAEVLIDAGARHMIPAAPDVEGFVERLSKRREDAGAYRCDTLCMAKLGAGMLDIHVGVDEGFAQGVMYQIAASGYAPFDPGSLSLVASSREDGIAVYAPGAASIITHLASVYGDAATDTVFEVGIEDASIAQNAAEEGLKEICAIVERRPAIDFQTLKKAKALYRNPAIVKASFGEHGVALLDASIAFPMMKRVDGMRDLNKFVAPHIIDILDHGYEGVFHALSAKDVAYEDDAA